MASQPPLAGIRVLEFAGLAPGPYAGLLLADYGASVLRIDRPAASGAASRPTSDLLTRHKASVALDLKSPAAITFFKSLLPHVDVVIDPFRPGVLEKLGLSPDEIMLKINPRLIVARMTGFRRDGKYSQMAGHDINYIAVSGVLSMLGRSGEKPYAPGNLLGDFAGGGAVCFVGILLALLSRERTGKGQVVGANMVDGSAHLATWIRLEMKGPRWAQPRGQNLLDGGSPFYDTYETSDGKFMAVGALEPQFFAALLKGMGLASSDLPGDRNDPSTWPKLRDLFTRIFKSKTRQEWETIFDGTDACCTPVLTQGELEKGGYDQRPIVTLQSTPGLAIAEVSRVAGNNADAARGQGKGVIGEGWASQGLRPGDGGEELLREWTGWEQGKEYNLQEGGLKNTNRSKL